MNNTKIATTDLQIKYPTQFFYWNDTTHHNFPDFEEWMNFWTKDFEVTTWEELESQTSKHCVHCYDESNFTSRFYAPLQVSVNFCDDCWEKVGA